MPNLVILNSLNYVPGSTNTFSYTLPQSTKFADGAKVGLAGLSIYNSTFNITALRGNNQLTYTWNAPVTTGASTSGSTASGATAIVLTNTTNLSVGQSISATGIPTGTTITAINTSSNTITISQATTAIIATASTITLNNSVYYWTIPDGYYSVSDINYWIQSQFIANKLYCTNTAGNVYFFDFVQNSVRYSVQADSYYIPTSSGATTLGYTAASGASWSFPSANQTPQMSWNSIFGSLIGQVAQTFPSTVFATNQSTLSTITPIISPVNSYILTCSLINSKYSLPSDTFFTVPITGAIGSLITYTASTIVMSNIAPNIYSNIIIKLFDQNWNQLQLIDKEVVITLCIDDQTPDKN